MARLLVSENDMDLATKALDDAFIDFDIDDGGRIMIDEDGLEEAIAALEEAGIDFDEV